MLVLAVGEMTMRQRSEDKMSATVQHVADWLISREQRVSAVDRATARNIVAREAKVAPGALERLERGRLKFVERVAGKLDAVFIRKLESQIRELEGELAIARLRARRPDTDEIFAVASALEQAKATLSRFR